jgi:hypothetical protein
VTAALKTSRRFEKDVMRSRSVFIGAAVAAIVAGVAAFVIGLRQPTEMRVGMSDDAVSVQQH